MFKHWYIRQYHVWFSFCHFEKVSHNFTGSGRQSPSSVTVLKYAYVFWLDDGSVAAEKVEHFSPFWRSLQRTYPQCIAGPSPFKVNGDQSQRTEVVVTRRKYSCAANLRLINDLVCKSRNNCVFSFTVQWELIVYETNGFYNETK